MNKLLSILFPKRSEQGGPGGVWEDGHGGHREHPHGGQSVSGGEDAGSLQGEAGPPLQDRPQEVPPDRHCLRRLHRCHVFRLRHGLLLRSLHDQGERDDLH